MLKLCKNSRETVSLLSKTWTEFKFWDRILFYNKVLLVKQCLRFIPCFNIIFKYIFMLIYICQNIISTSVIFQVINVILDNGKVFFFGTKKILLFWWSKIYNKKDFFFLIHCWNYQICENSFLPICHLGKHCKQ